MYLSAQHSAPGSEGITPAVGMRRIATKRRPQLLDDVFEHFPFGIVVVDAAHVVMASNRAARELVTIPQNGNGPGTCCDIFGCGQPGTALSGACLTEIALASGEKTPEVFIEVPADPEQLIAVTAAPLYADASHIIFQIRAATAAERSVSAEAEWLEQPRLKVHSLGRLRLTTWNGPLDGEWLGQRAGQLFKFLLTERHHFVPLEMIAEAVWPNANNRTGNTVRHCMHILRSKLEPDPTRRSSSRYILARNGGYRLNPDCVSVDADDFEKMLSDGMRAFANGDSTTAVTLFEAAVAMYHGDYLADDPYSEWAYVERERLRDLATIPLRALAELRSDEPDVALAHMQRLAEMEPFDNEIQRQLLIMLVKQGRRSRAVRLYQAFEIRLMRAFNEKPTFALSDIVSPRTQAPLVDGLEPGV
jgi:DNA-binding SARP family transcriptional activator